MSGSEITIIAVQKNGGRWSVVGVLYPEVDVMSNRFGSSAGSYPDLDRFNRVTTDRWTKDVGAGLHFYEADLTYDRNSNALGRRRVYPGRDVKHAYDGLDRLTDEAVSSLPILPLVRDEQGGDIGSGDRDYSWRSNAPPERQTTFKTPNQPAGAFDVTT